MAGVEEGWKTGGVLKGPGIPAPSGQYRVGCVDLMCQLEGDDKGLLVRLHYPTEATAQQGYQYSNWYPHKHYIRGLLNTIKLTFPGLMSTAVYYLVAPKIPALEGAPLYGCSGEAEEGSSVDSTPPTQSSTEQREEEGSSVDLQSSAMSTPPVFPVIVFSHGLKAIRTTYSGIMCDLASHGYVVACVEHRDKSAATTLQQVPKVGGKEGELQDQWLEYEFHDVVGAVEDPLGNVEAEFPYRNKQVKIRADEAKKTLDILTLLNDGAEITNMLGSSFNFKQFKGRLDISLAAVMGHSYGGSTTVQTLYEDSRFKCGIGLDSWLIPIDKDIYGSNTTFSQPLCFINSESFQWKENMKRMLSLTRPPDADGISTCRVITIKGTEHQSQSDAFFIAPRLFASLVGKTSALDIHTTHRINQEICHAFLRRHLLNDACCQPNLDGTEGHSEHLLFGTNVDMSETQSHLNNGTGVASAEGDVASAEGGVASAEGGVASAEGDVASAEGSVASAEGGVASAGEEGVASMEGASIKVEDKQVERGEGKREGKGKEEGGLLAEQEKAED